MSKIQVSGTGATGLEILLVLFIGLKLTGYINWSWWWVLSPIWIPMIIIIPLILWFLVKN